MIKNGLIIVLQVVILWFIAQAGTIVAAFFHSPIPGSILGFAVLFLLLQTRLLPLRWLERGANFLLAELLLFFVPSAVGVVQYPQFVRAHGWQVYAIIFISTITVMIVTGLLAERWQRSGRTLPADACKEPPS